MRVQVVRRGGLAGVVKRGEVDSAELTGTGASDAERLLLALPPNRSLDPGVPDSFSYEITITDGDEPRSVLLGEADVPAALRPVIDAALAHGKLD